MESRRYVRIVLLISLGLYVAARLGLATYCEFQLQTQDVRDKNRLVNIHVLPREAVVTAIDVYASRMPREQGNIIFLGDSQTYGYNLPPGATCAAVLQKQYSLLRPKVAVHNLAVVDGRFRDSLRIIEVLEKRAVPIETVVLSSNPTHFVVSGAKPVKDSCIPRSGDTKGIFASLILTRDNVFDITGASWRSLRKGHPVDLFDDLMKSSETFAMADVGRGYCAELDPQSSLPDLEALLKMARRLAKRVILFTQPRYYADYLKAPYDYDWQPHLVDAAVMASARQNRCDVILHLADSFPRDHFSDLIHLNRRGHEALARILHPHLLPPP